MGWCTDSLEAEVCLHTNGRDLKCRAITCTEQDQDTYTSPNSTIDYVRTHKESILSPRTWAKYLNPAEWLGGIGGWQEGVIMGVAVLLGLVVLGVVVKVCKAFQCLVSCGKVLCCCCKGKRGEKRGRKRALHIEELLYGRGKRARKSPDNSKSKGAAEKFVPATVGNSRDQLEAKVNWEKDRGIVQPL